MRSLGLLFLHHVLSVSTILAPLAPFLRHLDGRCERIMAGHCRRLAFLVGLKTVIVIARGARCHSETGGASISSLLPPRAHLWHHTRV